MSETKESTVSPVRADGTLLNLLVDSAEIDAFLARVVRLAAEVVVPAVACGVTMRRDGQDFTAAASDPFAAQVDELQYGADEGPCLDSMRTGEIVEVRDLATDPRWDGYRPHAVAHGLASSLSLPLEVDGHTVGAMNLYATRRAAFAEPARTQATAFASQCSAALTVALRMVDYHELHRQLVDAMSARSVIDQALGVLMSEQRCDAATAFDLLRQASQRRNRKLRDIAADLVTGVSGRPPQPPPDFKIADPPRARQVGR